MLIPLGILSSSGAAPGDYERIATAFGTGSSAVITFSSIGAEYEHLQIRYVGKRTSGGGTDMNITFNGNTSAVYTEHRISSSNGTTLTAGNTLARTDIVVRESISSSAFGHTAGIIDITDYASSTKAKSLRSMGGNALVTLPFIHLASGMMNDTTPITSITITAGTSFDTTTRFSLYGIKG
jgi:hypothetical protein